MPWAKIAGILLSPPGVFLLVAVLAVLIGLRWRLVGRLLIIMDFAALAILSLPHTGRQLLMPLEATAKALPEKLPDQALGDAQAIVVLGGGRYADAPEYGADTVSLQTLERLRYAALLHRRTKLPILVSGGSPFDEVTPEAQLMRQVLENEFGIKVKWSEDQSDNTLENAQRTKLQLASVGIKRVYLVTHAWHMPRARWSFINAGLDVIPAPMGFTTFAPSDRRVLGYLPSARGLRLSALAIQERMGMIWYKFRHDTDTLSPIPEPGKPASPAGP